MEQTDINHNIELINPSLTSPFSFEESYLKDYEHYSAINSPQSSPELNSPQINYAPPIIIPQYMVDPRIVWHISEIQKIIDEYKGKRNTSMEFNLGELVSYSQKEVSDMIGIPHSTLSKRWKEATGGRKWPKNKIAQLDRERKIVERLLTNETDLLKIAQLKQDLKLNKKQRDEEMKSVTIRLY